MTSLVITASTITSNCCKQCKENQFSLNPPEFPLNLPKCPACCETGLYCDIYTEVYSTGTEELLNAPDFIINPFYSNEKPQYGSLNKGFSDNSSNNEITIESAFKELKDYCKEELNKWSEKDEKIYKELAETKFVKTVLESDDQYA